jgi:hypothetical protein
MATMLACKIPSEEIKQHFLDTDMSSMFSDKYAHGNMRKRLKTASMYSSHFIEDSMEEILHKYTGVRNITLSQIYDKYGTTVIMSGTNVKRVLQPVYMSRFSFPDLPAARAVRASSSIPGMFAPVQVEDMLIVDGAMADAYLLKEIQNYLDLSECLCVAADFYKKSVIPKDTKDTIMNKIYHWWYVVWRVHPINDFTKEEKQHILPVTCFDCPSPVQLLINETDKQKIYDHGITSAKRYLSGDEYHI